MSTLERLEFTYTTQKSGGGNSTSNTIVKIRVIDTGADDGELITKPLPMTDLIVMRSQLEEIKKTLMANNNNNNNADADVNIMHRQQIMMMEKMMENQDRLNKATLQLQLLQHKQQNRTVEATAINAGVGNQPKSIIKVLSTISDNYNKVRTLIDMVMTLIEILLLYMAPLCLIVRTDYQLREVFPISTSLFDRFFNYFILSSLLIRNLYKSKKTA